MKTFIIQHLGENNEELVKILRENENYWDEIDDIALSLPHYYDVYGENGEVVAYFGVSAWDDPKRVYICYLYVKEQYRHQGIFNKIIKWCSNHYYEYPMILIGAKLSNTLADSIYKRKFAFCNYDEREKGNWYFVKNKIKE